MPACGGVHTDLQRQKHRSTVRPKTYQKSKPAVLACEMCRFAFQNDPFQALKRAVLQTKTARFVTPLIINRLQSARRLLATYQKTRLRYAAHKMTHHTDSPQQQQAEKDTIETHTRQTAPRRTCNTASPQTANAPYGQAGRHKVKEKGTIHNITDGTTIITMPPRILPTRMQILYKKHLPYNKIL